MIRLHEPRVITPRPQLDSEPSHDWRVLGLCAQTGPVDDVWLPSKGQPARHGKAICLSGCPVIRECLLFALNSDRQLEGVWGGTSESERRVLRRKWRARKAAEAARRQAGAA
ncbi:WhiB family transcriptional regulator [Terrabacter terrigena]|uniref:WhiB family transcriptional regulator n=1 Tax=Terrabacter terrigena TaxID=574718 RepID=A0ABW3MZX6_9MICO